MGKLDFTTHQGNSESLLAQVPFQDRTRRVRIDVTPIGIAEEALGLPAGPATSGGQRPPGGDQAPNTLRPLFSC